MTHALSHPSSFLAVTPSRAIAAAVFFVLVVAWVLYLLPATLGGKASFIIVNGSSMEPALNDGDLTLLHRRDSYSPGEIVAFRAGGGVAIHRIQSVQPDGTYVTKGDNKERIDPWLPGNANVLGEVVLRVPRAGAVLQNGGPLVFGLLVGALVTLALFWQDARAPSRARSSGGPSDDASARDEPHQRAA